MDQNLGGGARRIDQSTKDVGHVDKGIKLQVVRFKGDSFSVKQQLSPVLQNRRQAEQRTQQCDICTEHAVSKGKEGTQSFRHSSFGVAKDRMSDSDGGSSQSVSSGCQGLWISWNMCCGHTEIPFNAFGGIMEIRRQGQLEMEKLFKQLCLDMVTW